MWWDGVALSVSNLNRFFVLLAAEFSSFLYYDNSGGFFFPFWQQVPYTVQDNIFEIITCGFSFYISYKPDLFPIWSGARTCHIYAFERDCYNEKLRSSLGSQIIRPKGTQCYENMRQLRAKFPFPITKKDSLNYKKLESEVE